MMPNIAMADVDLDEARQQGRLLCQCKKQKRVWLELWEDYECGRCGKAILWSPDD